MGYAFIDSDLLIQAQENDKLEDLIAKHGIDGFTEIENRINSQIDVENTVISTGGSICYCDGAMKHFKENGLIIYLRLPYNTIKRRVGNLSRRGVVIRKGSTLRDLYDERTPLYEKYADIPVDLAGCSIRKSVNMMKSVLYKNKDLLL